MFQVNRRDEYFVEIHEHHPFVWRRLGKTLDRAKINNLGKGWVEISTFWRRFPLHRSHFTIAENGEIKVNGILLAQGVYMWLRIPTIAG